MSKKINLLVAEDEGPFRNLLQERFSNLEFNVSDFSNGEDALGAAERQEFDVGVIDMRMPGMSGIELFGKIRELQPHFEAVILTGQATIDSAIEALKVGAYDYLTKPCKLFELEVIVRKAYEKSMLAVENSRLRTQLSLNDRDYSLTGDSEKMQDLKKLVERVATSSTPVLIYGEAGVGKKYVARYLHQLHRPKDAPFIVVNCGVYTHGILENHLFGYEENAFEGAMGRKKGWLEMGDGGTLYLEDVEELHPSTQVKLHRFLETGTFQRIGGQKEIRSDARVVAGTENDLRDLVMKKSFREDLYYRLNIVTVGIPPLRDRKKDIPQLISVFLESDSALSHGKTFSQKAVNAMLKYDWPGNVRELYNVVERAAILAPKKTIQAKNIPMSLEKKTKASKIRHLMSLEEVEKEHILHVLSASGGNISRAARILGISRPKLYRKIDQYKSGKVSDTNEGDEEEK